MKTIGLLGGTSWPSTLSYYTLLNQLAHGKAAGFHSAKIILYSIDYHAIKSLYNTADGWNVIPALLKTELDIIKALPIDCLIIANNTLHKALDCVVQQQLWTFDKPIFHALELSAIEAKRQNCARVLLLGTAYTMQSDFFKQYFTAQGIEVVVPLDAEQAAIQAMQTAVALGGDAAMHTQALQAIVQAYAPMVQAVVLGCTELPLIISAHHVSCPIINPTTLQCTQAIAFACG